MTIHTHPNENCRRDCRYQGWRALTGGTEHCQRCGARPAVACLPRSLFGHVCAACAKLGGCPEEVVREGLAAFRPLARVHGPVCTSPPPAGKRLSEGEDGKPRARYAAFAG